VRGGGREVTLTSLTTPTHRRRWTNAGVRTDQYCGDALSAGAVAEVTDTAKSAREQQAPSSVTFRLELHARLLDLAVVRRRFLYGSFQPLFHRDFLTPVIHARKGNTLFLIIQACTPFAGLNILHICHKNWSGPPATFHQPA
jgi:hypothetical protein